MAIHIHLKKKMKDEAQILEYRGAKIRKNSLNGKWYIVKSWNSAVRGLPVVGYNSPEELKKKIDEYFTDGVGVKDYNLQPEVDVLKRQLMKCKNEGSEARRAGKSYAENPYSSGHERGAWQQGWREADRSREV